VPNKRRTIWFVALVLIHAALWITAAYLPRSLTGAVVFASFLPWLPLAWAHTPGVSIQGLVPLPNVIGLVWCLIVWLAVYWFVAGALDRLSVRLVANQGSKHAA
jgi:hypothetical protein